MTNFDRDDLIAFVQGTLPDDLAEELRHAANADPELAARLEALATVAGSPLELAGPERKGTSSRRRFLTKAGLTVGGIAAMGLGGVWGRSYWLEPKPLVVDDFDDGWLDIRIWETRLCRPRVKEENGYARLTNRGSLVTRMQFHEPIIVKFDWMWIDHTEDPLYPDILTVNLRTSGKHSLKHAYESLDGARIWFNPHSGRVNIGTFEWLKDDPTPIGRPLAESKGEPLPFASGVWHTITITDDGSRIAAFISGGKIKGRNANEPVVEAIVEAAGAERRVSIYNRELVGSSHESRIDNFSIRPLQ